MPLHCFLIQNDSKVSRVSVLGTGRYIYKLTILPLVRSWNILAETGGEEGKRRLRVWWIAWSHELLGPD